MRSRSLPACLRCVRATLVHCWRWARYAPLPTGSRMRNVTSRKRSQPTRTPPKHMGAWAPSIPAPATSNAAAACYDKALALAPDHPGIHYAYAMLLHSLGRNTEAIEHLRRAISGRPDHLDAHFSLGNLLYATGQDAEAIACYLKVLQSEPTPRRKPTTIWPMRINGWAKWIVRSLTIRWRWKSSRSYAGCLWQSRQCLSCARPSRGIDRAEPSRPRAQSFKVRIAQQSRCGVPGAGAVRGGRTRLRAGTRTGAEGCVRSSQSCKYGAVQAGRSSPAGPSKAARAKLSSLDVENQIAAHFAMGKALSDLGQYQDAFQHLLKANALKRQHHRL